MLDIEINQIFSRFDRMRVVVVGDSMVDAYLWGTVERISPEAPIPIVAVTHSENRLGGAANVSLNLQSLGADPVLFSVVGDDPGGAAFMELLESKNMPVHGIFVESLRKTTVKTRIIGKGRHIVRIDDESTHLIGKETTQKLVDGIKQELDNNRVDALIFVDYDKGVISPSLFEEVKGLAASKGIPIAVDPKKRNFNCYHGVDLFKPNYYEFLEGAGLSIEKGDFNALNEAACTFRKRQNLGILFITLAERGVFISNGENQQHFPAVVRQVADVSGAGDTVISVASLAMAAGLSVNHMAFMANIAGGIVCGFPGVVPVDRGKLIEMFKCQNL